MEQELQEIDKSLMAIKEELTQIRKIIGKQTERERLKK